VERNKGWLRAVFDPQMGTALSAIHDGVNTPWTVESLAGAAGMSRSAFAARFKELLGQTPLEYVTEWRMQKAMQLLQQRDKKLIDVGRSVTSPTLRSVRRSSELRGPGAMEILPLKWASQVPRTRERETTDPKPTMISPGKAIKPPIHLDGLSPTCTSASCNGFPCE
jgi:AraC-like DNA-binding protein